MIRRCFVFSFLFFLVFGSTLYANSNIIKSNTERFERINPSYSKDVVLSYSSSIKNAKDSVVNISTKKEVEVNRGYSDLFKNPFFEDFFGKGFDIPKKNSVSLGSGVVVSKNGYIVTNYHVVEDAKEIIITASDGKEYEASIVASDPNTDISVVKIDAKDLTPIVFSDSSKTEVGDLVFAIGNPFGIGTSVTQGIVSALHKDSIGVYQYENFIQTDAPINPGSSGGALIDSRGYLVGMNSVIITKSGGNNGIGLAIPSNMIENIANKLIKDGKIERGYLGVVISNLTKDLKDVYKHKEGALVLGVEDGSSASKAGIKVGDLIFMVNGNSIKDSSELKNLVAGFAPDSKINLKIERDKKDMDINVVLMDLPNTISSLSSSEKSSYVDGLKLTTLSEDYIKRNNLPEDITGVLVLDVKLDSQADESGFLKGDIIYRVEKNDIKNVGDFKKALEKTDTKKRVYVKRNNYSQILVLE